MQTVRFLLIDVPGEGARFFRRALESGQTVIFRNYITRQLKLHVGLVQYPIPPAPTGGGASETGVQTSSTAVGHFSFFVDEAAGSNPSRAHTIEVAKPGTDVEADLAFSIREGVNGEIKVAVAKIMDRNPQGGAVLPDFENKTGRTLKVAVAPAGTYKNNPDDVITVPPGIQGPFSLDKPATGDISLYVPVHKGAPTAQGNQKMLQPGGTDQGDLILLP